MPARGSAVKLLLAAVLALVSLVAACGEEGACGGEGAGCGDPGLNRFDSERAFGDLRRQVAFGPRPAGSQANAAQAEFLARRLEQAGAAAVTIQEPWANVVGTIHGDGEGAVLIGAHHDTVAGIPGFVGANDGASGVAVVLELARALADSERAPTVHVALFDAEEARPGLDFEQDGTRGSRQYVELGSGPGSSLEARQGSAPIDDLDAMLLFDLIGDCQLGVPREANSDPDLYAALAAGSEEVGNGGAPFEGETGGILDDHIPFLEAGVPAVDVIDFSYGPGGSPGEYWHTDEDTLDKVCPESLDAVGEPAVQVIEGLGDPVGSR